mgnify:FL=1
MLRAITFTLALLFDLLSAMFLIGSTPFTAIAFFVTLISTSYTVMHVLLLPIIVLVASLVMCVICIALASAFEVLYDNLN